MEDLTRYTRMGFDLVTFSGGKALRGPQCSGLLLGRKDLIKAALVNNDPISDTISRSCKVGKEEIVGMVAADGEAFDERQFAAEKAPTNPTGSGLALPSPVCSELPPSQQKDQVESLPPPLQRR